MRIDAHHHLWHYDPVAYDWIDDSMAVIRRDFLPNDLAETTTAAGIDGVISVQARQMEEETRWLLELAADSSLIRGVVGWLPLISPELPALLDSYAAPKLVGLRHVLQGEPDPAYMLGADFNRGIAELTKRDLAYDILILEHQLPQAIELVDRHPQQRFIVDHIAKPRIRDGELQPWADRMRDLARRPNVWCKLSGVVTEADPSAWTPEQLRPYMETALECFGPQRLMFGSDWPVCLVGMEYARWVALVEDLVSRLSPDEQTAFWASNATRAYRLDR
ncbi:MAG: amidohydrolase family protein [Verrucomicrobiota bacterium JB022]|nr:amidohydrolase family protein [Verrucomicrobiota bacterium JB022]